MCHVQITPITIHISAVFKSLANKNKVYIQKKLLQDIFLSNNNKGLLAHSNIY